MDDWLVDSVHHPDPDYWPRSSGMAGRTPAPNSTLGSTDTPGARLRRHWRILARVAWLAAALLIIAVFAVSIPPFFNLLRGGAPCATDPCAWQLEAASIQTL